MILGLIKFILPILAPILDRLIPDPAARAKAEQDILSALMNADVSQLEVNKAEAQTGNMFIAGWRPFIGWTCGIALMFNYVARPFGVWILSMVNEPWATKLLNSPTIDNVLWELMFGMLGMAGFRSYEKIKGLGR